MMTGNKPVSFYCDERDKETEKRISIELHPLEFTSETPLSQIKINREEQGRG